MSDADTTVLTEFKCPECGKQLANAAGLAGHARTHIQAPSAPEKGTIERSRRLPGDNKLYGARRMGMRAVKMAYPRCEECQARDDAPGWWYRCEARGHEPYFSADHYDTKFVEKVEPDEDGDLVVIGRVEKKILVKGGPNIKQVHLTGRHNGNVHDALRKARGKGLRDLQEVGIDPMCEFPECWTQDNLTFFEGVGTFCSKDQAKAVAADQRHIKLEVLNQDKIGEQWASIAV